MIRKKVYYVPGLISLIGLPLLLLLFGPEDKIQQGALRLVLPTDKLTPSDSVFTAGNVLKATQGRKVIDVDLWDKTYGRDVNWDKYINDKKLLFIQHKMEELEFTHDTTAVLKVELSEGNTYGEFVWLINQATIYGYKRYAFSDDAFYFFANDPPVDYSKIPAEPLIIDDNGPTINYTPPGEWEIFMRDLKYRFEEIGYMLKYNLPLSIGFLLLIIVPSLYSLSRRKTKLAY